MSDLFISKGDSGLVGLISGLLERLLRTGLLLGLVGPSSDVDTRERSNDESEKTE